MTPYTQPVKLIIFGQRYEIVDPKGVIIFKFQLMSYDLNYLKTLVERLNYVVRLMNLPEGVKTGVSEPNLPIVASEVKVAEVVKSVEESVNGDGVYDLSRGIELSKTDAGKLLRISRRHQKLVAKLNAKYREGSE